MPTRSLGSGIVLNTRLGPLAAPLRCDAGQLEQVLVDLVLQSGHSRSGRNEVTRSPELPIPL